MEIYQIDNLDRNILNALMKNARTAYAELAKLWPIITEVQKPQADADEWNGKEGKLDLLER